MLDVSVKTMDGKNHQFSVPDETTVLHFKERIASSIDLAVIDQRLIFQGRVLQDVKMLRDVGVDGRVIHVVGRPPPAATSNRSHASTATNQDDNEPGFDINFGLDDIATGRREIEEVLSATGLSNLVGPSVITSALQNGDRHFQLNMTQHGNQNTNHTCARFNVIRRMVALAKHCLVKFSNPDAAYTEPELFPTTSTTSSDGTSSTQATVQISDVLSSINELSEINALSTNLLSAYQDIMKDGATNSEQARCSYSKGRNAEEIKRICDITAEFFHHVGHANHGLGELMAKFGEDKRLGNNPPPVHHPTAIIQQTIPVQAHLFTGVRTVPRLTTAATTDTNTTRPSEPVSAAPQVNRPVSTTTSVPTSTSTASSSPSLMFLQYGPNNVSVSTLTSSSRTTASTASSPTMSTPTSHNPNMDLDFLSGLLAMPVDESESQAFNGTQHTSRENSIRFGGQLGTPVIASIGGAQTTTTSSRNTTPGPFPPGSIRRPVDPYLDCRSRHLANVPSLEGSGTDRVNQDLPGILNNVIQSISSLPRVMEPRNMPRFFQEAIRRNNNVPANSSDNARSFQEAIRRNQNVPVSNAANASTITILQPANQPEATAATTQGAAAGNDTEVGLTLVTNLFEENKTETIHTQLLRHGIEVPLPHQELGTLILDFIINNFSFMDLFEIVHGIYDSLTRVRSKLVDFVSVQLLKAREVRRMTNEEIFLFYSQKIAQILDQFINVELTDDNINIIATMRHFTAKKLVEITRFITNSTDKVSDFGDLLMYHIMTNFQQFLHLSYFTCKKGQNVVSDVVLKLLNYLLSLHFPSDYIEALRRKVRQILHKPPTLSEQNQVKDALIYHKMPMAAEADAGPSKSEELHGNENETETYEDALEDSDTASTSVNNPTTSSTNNDWRSIVPRDWIGVIEQDIVQQRNDNNCQNGASDAYMNGMPSARRRKLNSEASGMNENASSSKTSLDGKKLKIDMLS